jgi:hypothetical protein
MAKISNETGQNKEPTQGMTLAEPVGMDSKYETLGCSGLRMCFDL